MSDTDSLCRVSVYADDVGVDVTLPGGVPVAVLMPAILEIVAAHGYRPDPSGTTPYQLAPIGSAPLDASMTLAQNLIRDGAGLLLTRARIAPPLPVHDDAAVAVADAVAVVARPPGGDLRLLAAGWSAGAAAILLLFAGAAATPFAAVLTGVAGVCAMAANRARHPAASVMFALWAAALAAVTGSLMVPHGPGAPNALLASVAAATVSVLALRLLRGGVIALTAVATVAILGSAAALARTLTGVAPAVLGSAAATASIGLLQVSAWTAVGWAGLAPFTTDGSPPPRLGARAAGAHQILTGLVVAVSIVCAAGAVAVAAGGGIALCGLIGAVLVLRGRAHTDRVQVWALSIGGCIALTGFLGATMLTMHRHPIANCVAALALSAAAWHAHGAAPGSPGRARVATGLEHLALAAIVPLTCWTCGLFGAVRGLAL